MRDVIIARDKPTVLKQIIFLNKSLLAPCAANMLLRISRTKKFNFVSQKVSNTITCSQHRGTIVGLFPEDILL